MDINVGFKSGMNQHGVKLLYLVENFQDKFLTVVPNMANSQNHFLKSIL